MGRNTVRSSIICWKQRLSEDAIFYPIIEFDKHLYCVFEGHSLSRPISIVRPIAWTLSLQYHCPILCLPTACLPSSSLSFQVLHKTQRRTKEDMVDKMVTSRTLCNRHHAHGQYCQCRLVLRMPTAWMNDSPSLHSICSGPSGNLPWEF